MPLSIREASRFIIGAAMMRTRAIESSGNSAIGLDDIAQMALLPGPDGQKIRQSIATLADNDPGSLRHTPPHVLKTDRVLASRESEISTFRAIGSAVMCALSLSDLAFSGDADARAVMHTRFVDAYKLIDETPGSTQDRRQLEELLQVQAIAAGYKHPDAIAAALKEAESDYLDKDASEILSRYGKSLEPSTDFDM